MKHKNQNEKGAILIGLVITIVIVGMLASTMSLMTSNIICALGTANLFQAQYVSESGLRYLLKKREGQTDIETFIKEYNQTRLYMPFNDSNNKYLRAEFYYPKLEKDERVSRGLIIESRADCMHIPSIGAERDMMISDNRTPVLLSAELIDIDAMYIIPKDVLVRLEKMEVGYAFRLCPRPGEDNLLIRLRWIKNEALPDLKYWQDRRTKGLPYNIQVKLSIYRNESYAKHFMVGISFRVNYEHLSSYGISIFKTAGRLSENPPNWVLNELDLNSFKFNEKDNPCSNPSHCLDINTHYVVVWVKEEKKKYKLLAYSPLTLEELSDDYYNLFEPSDERLKQWVTLALDLDEQYVGGLKKNEIRGEIQGPTDKYGKPIYPKGDRIRWDKFIKLKWKNRVEQIIADRTLTSKDLEKEQPDEIGLHVFIDNKICEREGKSNCDVCDIYIDGFVVDCINCPSSNTQSIVQY